MSENNIGRPQGGTMLDKVKADNNAPARINSEFQMPKIRLKDTDTPQQYRCTCCGKVYTKQEGNFLKALENIHLNEENQLFFELFVSPIRFETLKTCVSTAIAALL